MEEVSTTGSWKYVGYGILPLLAPLRRPPSSPPPHSVLVPLKAFAHSQRIQTVDAPPETLKHWELPGRDYDLGIVVSFGYFIPSRIIQQFRMGAMNVHPSLLPLYRGASPIQYAIMDGVQETGVSIIELHPDRFDAGRILDQQRVVGGIRIRILNSQKMPHDPCFRKLVPKLAAVGASSLLRVMEDFPKFQSLAKEQPASSIICRKAPKIRRELARVRWSEHSAQELYRIHRAIGHQHDLYSTLHGDGDTEVLLTSLRKPWEADKELEILRSSMGVPSLQSSFSVDNPLRSTTQPPGSWIWNPITNTLFVKTKAKSHDDGVDDAGGYLGSGWLGIRSLQLPTRAPMDAGTFVHSVLLPWSGGDVGGDRNLQMGTDFGLKKRMIFC